MPEFGKIELSLIIGGMVLAGLGSQWTINILISLGVFLFGTGLLIGGIKRKPAKQIFKPYTQVQPSLIPPDTA